MSAGDFEIPQALSDMFKFCRGLCLAWQSFILNLGGEDGCEDLVA
jgi:hypothetical protein